MTNQSAKEQVREILKNLTLECYETSSGGSGVDDKDLDQALSQIEEIVFGVIDTKLPNEDKMLNTCQTAQDGLRTEQLKRWSDK